MWLRAKLFFVVSFLCCFTIEISAQEIEVIARGDSKETALKLINSHGGIKENIAYARMNGGKRSIATPELSYHLPHEECHVMIELDKNQHVVRVEYAVAKPKIEEIKDGFTIKEIPQFVFSKKKVARSISLGEDFTDVSSIIESDWRNRKLSPNSYLIRGNRVSFFLSTDSTTIERIQINGVDEQNIVVDQFVSIFLDRTRKL